MKNIIIIYRYNQFYIKYHYIYNYLYIHSSKIMKTTNIFMKTTNTSTFPEFQMSLQFIDMTIKKPKVDA
jgi:hypothetical protein